MKRKLAKVDIVRTDMLTDKEIEKFGVGKHKGLIAIEVTLDRDKTIEEVLEIVRRFNNNQKDAFDYYEEMHLETIDKIEEHNNLVQNIKTRNKKYVAKLNELHAKYESKSKVMVRNFKNAKK